MAARRAFIPGGVGSTPTPRPLKDMTDEQLINIAAREGMELIRRLISEQPSEDSWATIEAVVSEYHENAASILQRQPQRDVDHAILCTADGDPRGVIDVEEVFTQYAAVGKQIVGQRVHRDAAATRERAQDMVDAHPDHYQPLLQQRTTVRSPWTVVQ